MSVGIQLFGPLAQDYARFRPGYPSGVLDTIVHECGLTRDWVIADVGSGTGNLARLFLEDRYQVICVEPNREMRQAAEHLLGSYDGFRMVDGSAERIPIDENGADLVTVGQAIHWFDIESARTEFRRILRPDG